MAKALKLHPRSVASVLQKAVFEKSEWLRSGQIRGWGHSARGFSVKANLTGYGKAAPIESIEVSWYFGDWYGQNKGEGVVEQEYHDVYVKMEKVLRDAGYEARISSGYLGNESTTVTLPAATRTETV